MKKLAVALGLREKTEKDFKNMIDDMHGKFKNKQGLFMGQRNTFTALDGHPDQPEKRAFQNVSSTVAEQMNWFKEHAADYLKVTLSIEKTNATGIMAELVVDGKSWGTFSTLELLRLKGILDSKLKAMVQDLPIRPETVLWSPSTDPTFAGRTVFETSTDKGRTKTTIKRTIIVEDPHIKEAPNRAPVTQSIDTPTETGEYTVQNFSGAITNKERAEMEVRYNTLYKAVVAALEDANAAELKESELGDKVLDYLF